jgi:hypothetical protein
MSAGGPSDRFRRIAIHCAPLCLCPIFRPLRAGNLGAHNDPQRSAYRTASVVLRNYQLRSGGASTTAGLRRWHDRSSASRLSQAS